MNVSHSYSLTMNSNEDGLASVKVFWESPVSLALWSPKGSVCNPKSLCIIKIQLTVRNTKVGFKYPHEWYNKTDLTCQDGSNVLDRFNAKIILITSVRYSHGFKIILSYNMATWIRHSSKKTQTRVEINDKKFNTTETLDWTR